MNIVSDGPPPALKIRDKPVTVYLTLVDEDGQEVRINKKGEWTLYPYRSAAATFSGARVLANMGSRRVPPPAEAL